MYQSAVPAYGRDYKSKAAVLADWEAGRDFRCEPQGSYINKYGKPADMILNVRYSKLTKVMVIK
jgi:hypothetical protein